MRVRDAFGGSDDIIEVLLLLVLLVVAVAVAVAVAASVGGGGGAVEVDVVLPASPPSSTLRFLLLRCRTDVDLAGLGWREYFVVIRVCIKLLTKKKCLSDY